MNTVTKNLYIYASLAFCTGLLAVVFWVPALSDVLGLNALSIQQTTIALVASLLPLTAGQFWLWLTGSNRPEETD